MPVEINSSQAQVILKARQDLNLTQLELSEKAKISLRSIKDLESGRRNSFNEDTLIRLCRVLQLDCKELFHQPDPPPGTAPPPAKRKGLAMGLLIGLAVVVGTGLLVRQSYRTKEPYKRKDYLIESARLPVSYFNPKDTTKDWRNVNYFELDSIPKTGDTVHAVVVWSYYCVPGSIPTYFLNAFTQWNPDTPIPILADTTLRGTGKDTLRFAFICPQTPGDYNVRVFFSSSYGYMTSYFGHPPPSLLKYPANSEFIEIPIEVVPR